MTNDAEHFYVLICNFNIFFGEIFCRHICPFCHQVVCLIVKLKKVFIISGPKSFIIAYIFAKYVSENLILLTVSLEDRMF